MAKILITDEVNTEVKNISSEIIRSEVVAGVPVSWALEPVIVSEGSGDDRKRFVTCFVERPIVGALENPFNGFFEHTEQGYTVETLVNSSLRANSKRNLPNPLPQVDTIAELKARAVKRDWAHFKGFGQNTGAIEASYERALDMYGSKADCMAWIKFQASEPKSPQIRAYIKAHPVQGFSEDDIEEDN